MRKNIWISFSRLCAVAETFGCFVFIPHCCHFLKYQWFCVKIFTLWCAIIEVHQAGNFFKTRSMQWRATNTIHATLEQTKKCNNYHMTEPTHTPRRPSSFLIGQHDALCVHPFFLFLSFMVNQRSIIILSLTWNQTFLDATETKQTGTGLAHERSGLPLFGPYYAQWYDSDNEVYYGDDDDDHHRHRKWWWSGLPLFGLLLIIAFPMTFHFINTLLSIVGHFQQVLGEGAVLLQ